MKNRKWEARRLRLAGMQKLTVREPLIFYVDKV